MPRITSIVLAFLLLFSSACLTTEYTTSTHRQDTFLFSNEKEAAMGQNMAKQIAREFKLSSSPSDIERVDSIGKKISEVVDRKELSYYFYVVEKDSQGEGQVNAFSLPGGYVYVFKDLLDLLDDNELAFVLAHEIGHITSRHHIKRLQAALGYNLAILASVGTGADPQFSQGLSFALAQLFVAYSREDEFNADETAVTYSNRAGFSAASGINVLEKLYKEGKKEIRPLSYFRTHPYHAQRIRHIKEVLHLPLDIADYIN